MKRLVFALLTSLYLLASCQNMGTVTVAPNPIGITPSRPPIILSITPSLMQSISTSTPSPTVSISPSLTASVTGISSETTTPTPTLTETGTTIPALTGTSTPSPTATSTLQAITVQLLGCETGFDVTHGLGEVTNAYLSLENPQGPDLTSVCITLSSEDEGRPHPDKTICISSLPGGYQVTIRLTIDTTFQVSTTVSFLVTSNGENILTQSGLACQEIGEMKPAQEILNVARPIP